MLCSICKTDTVSWRGPFTAFTHTECSACGGVNCQVPEPEAPGDRCPRCAGLVEIEPVENCSCHLNPPCGTCTAARLMCNECGEFFE